jgi:hypothetical protein
MSIVLRKIDPASGGPGVHNSLKRLVELGLRGAGLGGDNGWGYYHSDKGEGDQEVMHGGGLLGWSSSELFHFLMIGPLRKFLNPT